MGGTVLPQLWQSPSRAAGGTMRILTGVRDLASKIFHSSQINDEIEEELRSHIQHRADDLQRSGLNRAGAERRARIEFGGYVRFTEEGHEAMGGIFWETLLKDVRLAFRVLRKSSGFGIVAMLTLALAIGANAVIFSVMNGLILRPLNVPQAQSLYAIERTADQNSSQSYPDYLDLRGRNRTFEDLAAFDIGQVALDTGQNPSRVWGVEASGNYFDVLRIEPYLGRLFHASDEHGPNSAPYIVGALQTRSTRTGASDQKQVAASGRMAPGLHWHPVQRTRCCSACSTYGHDFAWCAGSHRGDPVDHRHFRNGCLFSK